MRIDGLSGAGGAKYNGTVGTVNDFVAETGRWEVATFDGKEHGLKAEKLTPVNK